MNISAGLQVIEAAVKRGTAIQGNGLVNAMTDVMNTIHGNNVTAGWWTDLKTGGRLVRNVGELLMLCVSELAEVPSYPAIETQMDDKLHHRWMFEVELADCAIRLFDLSGGIAPRMPYAFAQYIGATTPVPIQPQNVDGMLMAVVRSLANAMEANRKGKHGEFAIYIAASLYRVFYIAIYSGLDIARAIEDKLAFNAQREDHKQEVRRLEGGKQY